jgi:hypothetical protein
MKFKLTTLLASGAVAMGLLLAASTALAQTVIRDPDSPSTVIRIEDLPVPLDQGAGVYDVHFRYQSGVTVYGANLGNFDFTQEENILVALVAVMDALNAEGSVPETAGVPTEDQFFIGGEEDDGFVAALGSEFFGAIWEECETDCLLLGTAILPASQKFTYADFVLAGNDPPDDPPDDPDDPPPTANCADISGQWAASIDSADLGDTVAGISNMQLGNSSIDVWLYPTTNGGSSDDFGVGNYTVDQWCNVVAEITLDSDGSTSTMAGIIVNPDVMIFNFANQVNNSSARMVARRVRSGSCSDISGQWAATMDEVVDGAERPTVGNMQLGASSLDFWLFQSSQGNDINDFGAGSYTVDQWCNLIGEITLDSDGSVSRIAGIIVSPDVMIFNYANQVNSASARVIARRVQIP